MLLAIFSIISAFLLFYLGTDCLIKGIIIPGKKLNSGSLLIRRPLIAAASSTPLFFLALNSTIAGYGGMAMGSIFGSNIFNVFVTIGIIALTTSSGYKLQPDKPAIFIAIASSILLFFLFYDRVISRPEGILLIILWIGSIVLRNRLGRKEDISSEPKDITKQKNTASQNWFIAIGWPIAGVILLLSGSGILIYGITEIARSIKIGTTIPGLTLIAAGCSLPLLVRSIVSVRKNQYESWLEIVIGSNILNLLGVTGIIALVHPVRAISISNFDLYFLIGSSLILLQFLRSKYILKRDEGILLILLYGVYVYYLWPK